MLGSLMSWLYGLISGNSNEINKTANEFYEGVDASVPEMSLFGILKNYLYSKSGARLTNAEREANQFTHNERIDAQNWTAQREDSFMQRTVHDYAAAGINPMSLAGGNVAAQPAGSSGGSSTSPGPTASLSELVQLANMREMLPLQKESLQADIANKKATAANIQADTDLKQQNAQGKALENRFNLDTYDLRTSLVDDQHAWNILRRELETRGITNQEEQTRIIRENGQAYRDFLAKQGFLLDEQAISESVKRESLKAQAREARQSAAYLATMGELNQRIANAETPAQKERLELLKLETQLKKGVYTDDYFDALRREGIAESDLKEATAAYQRGDYSLASKRLQKVFHEYERLGKNLGWLSWPDTPNLSNVSPLK